MIKAKDAYTTAVTVNEERHLDELANIRVLIDEASAEGDFSILWSSPIMDKTRDVLILDGFTIEVGGRMNETEYSIGWNLNK